MEEIIPYKSEEVLPAEVLQKMNDLSTSLYQKASELKITEEEQKKLQTKVDNNLIEIRPDGLIYYPQVFARQQLNETFGIGQWALIQHSVTKIGNVLCFDGSLYIRGCFVARAMGEHEYIESNKNTSWASVYESAKSDCLVRCCKDLGIGKELWQPQFSREWVKNNAVKVFVKAKSGETKVQWRRKDQEPFWNETGIVSDNSKPKPKEQEKPAEAKARNYTEEAMKFTKIKDLKDWYEALSDKEKKECTGLYKHTADELKKLISISKEIQTADALTLINDEDELRKKIINIDCSKELREGALRFLNDKVSEYERKAS
jgi:hypothetical protein